MDRRVFVQSGFFGLAFAGGVAEAQPVPARGTVVGPLRPRLPLQRLCRVRKDIRSLTAAELAAFKTGVQTMKARPATDPTSWAYQAAIHGSLGSPTRPLWNSCQHGTLHFFSWHRLFLYYFERILRQASGSSTLTLPYWNWQAQRALPAPFVDTTAGNPLFVSNRSAAMNSGGLLPASAVSTSSSFAETGFSSFSGQFEGTPHGAVHVSVGGWMGSVPTAGQDPIFWLHHCNVDRLWERWLAQGGGRANPTDATWRDRSFTFFDRDGTQVTRKAADALATCATLGYNYQALRFVLNPALVAQLLPLSAAVAAAAPGAEASRVSLENAVVQVPLATAPVRDRLASGGRVLLSFEGIRLRDTDGYYEIYLNPRATGGLSERDPSYAGNLVLFGAPTEGGAEHAGHEGADRRVFDLTRKLADLRRRGLLQGDELRVVLVLRLPEGGQQPESPEQPVKRATIERVRLVAP